jgi:parallel beta-helix repeat protein
MIVICLFVVTSIVSAFSFNLKDGIDDYIESKVESFTEKNLNEIYPDSRWCYDDVMNPNLGYEEMMDFRERLNERYVDYLEDHDEYFENHIELMEEYENHLPKSEDSPSERPDFENGTTWYVDDIPGEGPDNPPEDFNRIQLAIDSELVKEGDTIYVYSGIYRESVVITKSIILQGEDRNNTIIDNGGESRWIWDSLIKFDVYDIPFGSNIASANLNIYYFDYYTTCPVGRELQLYRATSPWNEESVSWNSQPSYVSTQTTNSKVPRSFGWMTWDVTNDIQAFINKSVINHGWKIADETYWGGFDIPETVFYSKEYDNGIYHPYLNIQINGVEDDYNTLIDGYDSVLLYPSDDCYIVRYPPETNYGSIKYFQVRNDYGEKHRVVTVDVNCVTICGFKIQNGSDGIFLASSSHNNVILKNTLTNNTNGILLVNSNNNIIAGNKFEKNAVDGIGITYFSNNNNIENNNFTENLKGLSIRSSFSNNLLNNHFKMNHQGILLNDAFFTIIEGNDISINGIGIYLHRSIGNHIQKNMIYHNSHKGITLRQFSFCNNIHNNYVGPWNYQGFYIEKSYFNNIHQNNITRNNDDGIGLIQTFGNKIHHNNILDNTDHEIEGTLCFDDARNNYWGEEPPQRWILTNENDADIYTPGGFLAINPILGTPVEV